MDKIYQVFVSSTFVDLQEERKEVMQALLELDCMPAGMELFPASNDDQWTLIKRVIDACDYYLLIIGGRYGSVNDQGISYTQMEFEYALSTGKPIISFLHKNPGDIPVSKSEQDTDKQKKLEAFRNLAQKKLVRYWETPTELGSTVSRSMIKLIKDFPAEGWVRAGSAVDEKSVKEIARLQNENTELKAKLEAIATEPPKGADIFSQGDDYVNISFTFISTPNLTHHTNSIMFTWDELFSQIAPNMINECTENELRGTLNEYIAHNTARFMKELKFPRQSSLSRFSISDESFGVIRVQFRALGLIELSEKKRTASDKSTYWKLTPHGDYQMTTLVAIRK